MMTRAKTWIKSEMDLSCIKGFDYKKGKVFIFPPSFFGFWRFLMCRVLSCLKYLTELNELKGNKKCYGKIRLRYES